MRKCKQCNGKGLIFAKSNSIFTGKTGFMGLPDTTSGFEKEVCPKCYGKGMK